uniref:Uncharacterized protein n=1 Tax=Anopheles albimanus TaxID=7167 RepID=A0A182G012_ANOAL
MLPLIVTLINPLTGTSVLLDFEPQFAFLARNITFSVVQIDENQRSMLSTANDLALVAIAMSSSNGRERTQQAFDFIESFDGDVSPKEQLCLSAARESQRSYAQLLGDDISYCSGNLLYTKASNDSNQYNEALNAAHLLSKRTSGAVLEVLTDHMDSGSKEQVLSHRLQEHEKEWFDLQLKLNSLSDRIASEIEVAREQLSQCLDQAILFFNYTIAYVKDELEECFANDD